MLMLFRIRGLFKQYARPLAQYLSFKHSKPIKCEETSCGIKSLSFRAVSVLYILMLLIGVIATYFITKELLVLAVMPLGVFVLSLFAPERCPKCKSTNVTRITQIELEEYYKEREQKAEKLRELE